DPNQHDYSFDKPEMVEVRPGHFVWGNKKEIETYRKEQSK
ncbi:MAG: peptide ABC transporter ATP-binding protein, partial [Streptococcus vestibularis]|nr:peptide ABC transporter ATP-binding protein [Streptococcus vestibularis]